jgi:hypothetical protein
MSALIAGLDISSKALHAALIPLDPDDGGDPPPVTLRSFDLPVFKPASTTPAYRRVERCRVIRDAMRELLQEVIERRENGYFLHDAAHVCIEEPFGSVSRSTVLWEILGAILASIPPHIERDTIQTNEWRKIIWPGAQWAEEMGVPFGDWKQRAIDEAYRLIGGERPVGDPPGSLNEHEAESLLIARACRTRLEKAVAP